jgi:hypothetical protein
MSNQESKERKQHQKMTIVSARNMMQDIDATGRQMIGQSTGFLTTVRPPHVGLRPEESGGVVGLDISSLEKNKLSTSLGDVSFSSFDCTLSLKDLSVFESREELQNMVEQMSDNLSSQEKNEFKLSISVAPGVSTIEKGQKTDWYDMFHKKVAHSSSSSMVYPCDSNDQPNEMIILNEDNEKRLPSYGSSFLTERIRQTSRLAAAAASARIPCNNEMQDSLVLFSHLDHNWLSEPYCAGTSSMEVTAYPGSSGLSSHQNPQIDALANERIALSCDQITLPSQPIMNFEKFYDAIDMTSDRDINEEDDRKPCARERGSPSTSSTRTSQNHSDVPKRSRKAKPTVKVYVDEITDCDVLLGRGGRSNHHPGNHFYLAKVAEKKVLYAKCKCKSEKTRVAQSVVDFINQERKGRFVELEKETGRWFIAANKAARTKVGQALRDQNTPEARAKKRKKYGC